MSAYWAVISDGAGGHAGGDIAAELAVAVVVSRFRRRCEGVEEALVVDDFAEANTAVRSRRRRDASVADMAAHHSGTLEPRSHKQAARRLGRSQDSDRKAIERVNEKISAISEARPIATGRNVSAEIGRWLARTGILGPDLLDGPPEG